MFQHFRVHGAGSGVRGASEDSFAVAGYRPARSWKPSAARGPPRRSFTVDPHIRSAAAEHLSPLIMRAVNRPARLPSFVRDLVSAYRCDR